MDYYDLNLEEITCIEGVYAERGSQPTVDNSTCCGSDEVVVYFRNLESHLIRHINNADAVVGCVAWLTSKPILEALAKKKTSIIVQKEDFLRPDLDSDEDWTVELRKLYSNLGGLQRPEIRSTILRQMSHNEFLTLGGVRCMGNHNSERKPAFPRMHNKFVVFCKCIPSIHVTDWSSLYPYGVWTGSFNFTLNSTYSLENALYIANPSIAEAYYKEYAQIAALSEPLDWEYSWVAPEWRIGS